MSTLKTRPILLLASLGIATLALAAPAQAYQCRSQPETAALSSPNQAAALAGAKAAWTGKVRGKLGLPWSVWTIAAAPQQACAAAGGGAFICSVAAKPCLYVVE
jgi:hypothetical protein